MARCPNVSCPAQFFELLKHFVGRGSMDIDRIGEKLCQALIDAGLVEDVADLYDLTRDDLLGLERMGDKSADNVLESIERILSFLPIDDPIDLAHPRYYNIAWMTMIDEVIGTHGAFADVWSARKRDAVSPSAARHM